MKDTFILIILIVLCSTALGQENTAEYWFQKGNGFYNNASYELAVRCYDKGLEIDPSNGTILLDEGRALLNLSRYDEALKVFERATNLDPYDEASWNNKGVALVGQGKQDEAIKCFDKAINITPLNKNAWRNKGLALYSLGKYEEAIRCLDNALQLDPSDESTRKIVEQATTTAQKQMPQALQQPLLGKPQNAPDWFLKAMTSVPSMSQPMTELQPYTKPKQSCRDLSVPSNGAISAYGVTPFEVYINGGYMLDNGNACLKCDYPNQSTGMSHCTICPEPCD